MREILDANILFLSLCPKGKNGFATLYKSADETVEFRGVTVELSKFDERGLLAAVVWAPGIEDADGDFASGDVVEKMAHSFMKNGAKIDTKHDMSPLEPDAVHVAESFIIQKGDPRFSDVKHKGVAVDVTGGWGTIIQVNDAELRKSYRSGDWAGVSMFGPAKVRKVTVQKAVVAAPAPEQENEDMKTTEEIQAVVDAQVKKILDEKAEADQVAADKIVADAALEKADAPKDVDLDDADAVAKYAEDMEFAALKKAVDWTDADAVKAYAEVVKLRKGAEKPAESNLSQGDTATPDLGNHSEAELRKMGETHAASINKKRGL